MDETEKRISGAVEPFIALGRGVVPHPNRKLVDYMYVLVKDKRAYAAFVRDPVAGLAGHDIRADAVDVRMFADLAKHLHDRANGRENPFGRIANSLTAESNTGQQHNFDHSKSATREFATNTTTEAGQRADTSSSSAIETNTKFDGFGIKPGDEILRHELQLLFYPSQPLVTPELVTRIKDNLGKP